MSSVGHATIRYAPSWKRLISYVIDMLLIEFSVTIIWWLVFEAPISLGLVYTISFVYNIIMDYFFEGTIGKMVLRIKVIKTNGRRIDFQASVFRNLGKIVSWLPLGWGYIRLLTPSFPQAIHDELARCYVVEK